MLYSVVLTRSSRKELERLETRTHDRIIDALHKLEENPRLPGAKN